MWEWLAPLGRTRIDSGFRTELETLARGDKVKGLNGSPRGDGQHPFASEESIQGRDGYCNSALHELAHNVESGIMARPTRNAHELWALICQRGMMKAVFMFRPAYLYKEEEVEQAVTSVKERFRDDVESVRYSVRDDWSDDPAIFFRILLKISPA